jgi:pyruvate dehydrogenase E2 component (dihydrolipoamide acetyltransferase)
VPTFGLTEGEATITEWLKGEGDQVVADEVLFVAENEKATLEVPSPNDGVLLAILARQGETVPLMETVAWIGEPGEPLESEKASTVAAPEGAPDSAMEGPGPAETREWVKATPIARRLARQYGLDLHELQGSGPGGRVKQADVERAVEERQRASRRPADVLTSSLRPLSIVRRTTAERMAESFRTAPHFYLQIEVLAGRLVELRSELLPEIDARTGLRLTYTDLLLLALARVLPDHPLLNATWQEGQVRTLGAVNLCIAVAGQQGLVAPVVRRADALTLEELVEARHTLSENAIAGRLAPEEVRGGTFTLTNLGMYGIDTFIPILNPPQSAILAAGAIKERPVGESGAVVLRPTLPLTLAADHRVVDGAQAALFLTDMRELLQAPARMLMASKPRRSSSGSGAGFDTSAPE